MNIFQEMTIWKKPRPEIVYDESFDFGTAMRELEGYDDDSSDGSLNDGYLNDGPQLETADYMSADDEDEESAGGFGG